MDLPVLGKPPCIVVVHATSMVETADQDLAMWPHPGARTAYDALRMDVEAQHHTRSSVVVGRLVLARTAMRFGPVIRNARFELELPLVEIASVRTARAASLATNAVVVEHRAGARFIFEVRDPEAVLLALEAAVAAARGPVYR